MVSIKTILEELMKYYNLTQKELAKKFDVTETQISRWLNGKSEPRMSEFRRFSEEYEKTQRKAV